MPGTTDKIKGRAKVATGAVTGDKSLENEGRMDRLAGEAKDRIDETTSTLQSWLRNVTDRAGDALKRGQRALEDLVNKIKR